jgi:hypothetical protein
MEKPEHGFIEEVTKVKRLYVTPQFIFSKIYIAQGMNVGLDEVAWLEESARFLPCLEDERHLGELSRARANIQSVQVVPQDERGDLVGRVTFFLVDNE